MPGTSGGPVRLPVQPHQEHAIHLPAEPSVWAAEGFAEGQRLLCVDLERRRLVRTLWVRLETHLHTTR